MIAFVINLFIALFWMMLFSPPSIMGFITGFVIGFFLIIPFRKLMKDGKYYRRTFNLIKFIVIFLFVFIKSNLAVAKIVLFVDKKSIKPSFITYDISHLTWFESLLISYCITLTPGTISVELNKNDKNMIIHCLDTVDPKEISAFIDTVFKEAILRFSR